MSTLKIVFCGLILGLFLISSSQADDFDYLLTVSINERNLTLYKINTTETEKLGFYPIAAPANDWLPLPLIGKVKKIEINPWWYPTEKTRIAYLKKKGTELPSVLKPDDLRNAMGKAKIIINFENFETPIRIHGTNDPSSIGKRVSRGCIRMHNEDIEKMAQTIQGLKTKVIIK